MKMIFLDFDHIYNKPFTNKEVHLLYMYIYDIINNVYLYIVYGLNA